MDMEYSSLHNLNNLNIITLIFSNKLPEARMNCEWQFELFSMKAKVFKFIMFSFFSCLVGL